jgi:DHA2 family multidrug resistance protein
VRPCGVTTPEPAVYSSIHEPAHGSSLLQARDRAVQWIGQQVQGQASFIAYMDAFWVLMLISLAAVPLALTLRSVKLGGSVTMGH